jgi:hypothetical protein
MTRFLSRTIDIGASIVFMAFCAKAFGVHLYEYLRRPRVARCAESETARLGTAQAAQLRGTV